MFALITAVISSMEILIMKKICSFKNVKKLDAILITLIFSGLFSLLILYFRSENLLKTIKTIKTKDLFNVNILFIIGLAILLILNRHFFIMAIDKSPNPGYANLIVNTNVILTLFLSFLIFNSSINIYTITGSLIAILGIGIVIKYSNK